MKKFMSIMLTMGLMASSMSLGFAATDVAKEIEDKDVKEAVERLAAFGIVNGMEDGKYHEELKVTREQFAKILVTALGLDSAAIQGPTQFADVEAGRWSSGYVNVAVGQGILKGYPDGTFQPTKEVSYGEAVTMLVRALGYKDEFLPGQWPANYIAKAADEDITDGVKFVAGGTSNRGDVAIMVNNTLDAEVVKVKEYGTIATYETSDKTLLEDKLDYDKTKQVRLTATKRVKDSLDKDEVEVTTLDEKLVVAGSTITSKNVAVEVDLKGDLNVEKFLGLEVTIYTNDDDEIVYMERSGNEKVAVDAIEDFEDKDKTEIDLFVQGDVVDADDNKATIYVNGEKLKYSEIIGKTYLFGTFVLEGNDVVFADLVAPEKTDNTGFVVTSIDEKNKEITGIMGTEEKEVIDLEDDYDSFQILDANTREKMELSDIKANDVIYVAEQEVDNDDVAYVYVVKAETTSGKLEKAKDDLVVVDGKEYKIFEDSQGNTKATISSDKNDKVAMYAQGSSQAEDLDDETVTLIKDVTGRVMHIVGDAKATSDDNFGYVKAIEKTVDGYKVKVYNVASDKDVVYVFENDNDGKDVMDFVDTDSDGAVDVDALIRFTLNSDGEIDEEFDATLDDDHDGTPGEAGEDAIEDIKAVTSGTTASFGKDTMRIGSSSLSVDKDDTKIFNITTGASSDEDIIKWADIEDDGDMAGTVDVAYFTDENNELEAVMFLNATTIGGDDEEAAYVVDTYNKSGDKFAEIHRYGKSVADFELDENYDKVTDKSLALVSIDGSGKADVMLADQDLTFDGMTLGEYAGTKFTKVAGWVYDKDGDYIKLYVGNNATIDTATTDFVQVADLNTDKIPGTTKDESADYDVTKGAKTSATSFNMSSDTLVYDGDDKLSKSSVSKGKKVEMIIEEGIKVRVIKIK